MTRASIRTIILLAAFSITGIIAMQIYWVEQALDLKEKQFDHRTRIALYGVAEELIHNTKDTTIRFETLNRRASNYYTLDFSAPANTQELEQLLITAFQNQSIDVNFEYGLFDCENDSLLFGKYVDMNIPKKDRAVKFDRTNIQNYYVGVLFPSKKSFLLNQMNIWLFFTAVLILVVLFFGYTVWAILKQRRLSEIKNDFINNMTHEFKTPISTIALASEVLMKDDIIQKPERIKQYVKIIHEENLRLKKHVESVLQVALFDSKKISFQEKEVDIHKVLQNIIKNLWPRLESEHGQIITDLKATNIIVNGDESHLANVFYNLFDNALKYCEQKPEIQLFTRDRKKGIEIEIKDNGKGMSHEELKHIFEKFYRVPSGNVHNVKGFGIGLFYVKQVIAKHNGKIKAESHLNSGSSFIIWLPVKKS